MDRFLDVWFVALGFIAFSLQGQGGAAVRGAARYYLVFSLVLAAYFVTLFDAQIVHGAEYRARSIRANTKSETVVTSRGILTDRNGKALVTNRSVYTLELDTSLTPSDDAALNIRKFSSETETQDVCCESADGDCCKYDSEVCP